jgi:hypothetical protein
MKHEKLLAPEQQLKLLFSAGEKFAILCAIKDVDLPHCWLAGGAVRNTVWKEIFGADCRLSIKDFDVAFFDKDAGREVEARAREALQQKFPQHKFDVKNQASFGVWRDGQFVFNSSEDGIAHWLHTATAVGVRVNAQNEIEIFSPYGLGDLFEGVVRPTPEQVGRAAAQAKRDEFLSKCPQLKSEDA